MAAGNFKFGRVREPLRIVLAGAVFFAVMWMTAAVRVWGSQSTADAGSENASSRISNVKYSPPMPRRLVALLVSGWSRLTSAAHAVPTRTEQ